MQINKMLLLFCLNRINILLSTLVLGHTLEMPPTIDEGSRPHIREPPESTPHAEAQTQSAAGLKR